MVELVQLVKGTFRKFQLQAELAVLDHDVTNRQKAFGVELFDLIQKQRIDMRATIDQTNAENSEAPNVNPETIEGFLKVFQTIENEIRGPLEECQTDVDRMTEAKYLPLLIQRRKEQFGVQIWPIVSEPKWLHESLEGNVKAAMAEPTTPQEDKVGKLVNAAIQGVVKGTKSTITKAIGKLSPEQREVEQLVQMAKNDIAVVQEKKTTKLVEIEELVAGGTTLECC